MKICIKTYSYLALLFIGSDLLILTASYLGYVDFSIEYFILFLVNILLYLYCLRSIVIFIKEEIKWEQANL